MMTVFVFHNQHSVEVSDKVAATYKRAKKKKAVAPKILPKVANPLVEFYYYSSKHGYITPRSVRVISVNNKYLIGLEIQPDNKFQFKKYLQTKIVDQKILEFNPQALEPKPKKVVDQGYDFVPSKREVDFSKAILAYKKY